MSNNNQNVPETGSLNPPAPPRKIVTDSADPLKRKIPSNPSQHKNK